MVRRTVVLLAVMLMAATVGTVPAQAGGPTSVVLSAPPKLVAIGYEDRRYEELQRLTVGSPSGESGHENHAVGNFVRATWLIHDMFVWRLDIIYPEAPGGPWIARTEDTNGSGKLPDEPVWFKATADPSALLRLLSSLRLYGAERAGEQFYGGPTNLNPQPGAESTPATSPETVRTNTTAAAPSTFFTGWRWLIPGFLLGAVVAVLAVRLIPKRQDWQLTDIE